MIQKGKNLGSWIEELKSKIHDESFISNKEIMDFITEKDLDQRELAKIYEVLHENNIEVSFEEDASDAELDLLEEDRKSVV